MLYKSINEGFKDVDVKQGIVTGYFANFNSKDSDGDIIIKGAFKKTIQERGPESQKPRIKHLLDHSTTRVVGVLKVLKEDDYGLYYESKAGRHAAGTDFLLMVEDGIITEHSHGFEIIKEQYKEEANYIMESKLYEGSSLQFLGANPNTPIMGVKGFDFGRMHQMLIKYRSALKHGKYTDKAFIELEETANTLDNQLKSLTEIEPVALDVIAPTQIDNEPIVQILKNYRKTLTIN